MDRSHEERNEQSRARLRAFIERLSPEQLGQPLGDGWTPAAELVHVAFFDRRASRVFERSVREGASPSPYDVHIFNDAMLPQWLLIPIDAVIKESLAAAEDVDKAVAALTDEQLAAILEVQSVAVDRSHHRATHLDVLEKRFA